MSSDRAIAPLTYSIAGCSAYSGKYAPQNIIVDSPLDPSSRWSGAHHSTEPQWIMLQLQSVSIVQSITFGKYYKSHPCNMKEFKVLVGLTEDTLTEVLHSTLTDNKEPETFPIQYKVNSDVFLPARFVKIIPISAHSQSYHVSIWHVSLAGIADSGFVDEVTTSFEQYSEMAILRQVLKYLRQRRLLTPYHEILSRSGLRTEHPLVTQLFENLVLRGDWEQVEDLLPQMAEQGLFADYLRRRHPPEAIWTRIMGTDADGDRPSARGGHAMCMDPATGTIYLFGGWDGHKSLDDFWEYSIVQDRWHILSQGTSAENGPTPRSCHKMLFDGRSGKIFILGSLEGRTDSTGKPDFVSDLYCYHTSGSTPGKWDYLSHDTATCGGPSLIFDHQMALDSDSRTIYVFGGRIADGKWETVKFSGLYSYHIPSNKWRHLQPTPSGTLLPRFGHSMVLEPHSRRLIIFAGQREDTYLADMYSYDIVTNTVAKVVSDLSSNISPCFTQRAVLDPQLREIYVFCGLIKSNLPGAVTRFPDDSGTWLFSYDPSPGKWINVQAACDPSNSAKPQPRFAHQVVYDPDSRTVYLHGGNGGQSGEFLEKQSSSGEEISSQPGTQNDRLDDFWSMQLRRPAPTEIIRRCKFYVRQQQFREMCHSPVKALHFLQNNVYQIVNHEDAQESEAFRSLMKHLVSPSPPSPKLYSQGQHESRPKERPKSAPSEDEMEDSDEVAASEPSLQSAYFSPQLLKSVEDPLEKRLRMDAAGYGSGPISEAYFSQRSELFERLLEFVPPEAKQPSGSLVDLINA